MNSRHPALIILTALCLLLLISCQSKMNVKEDKVDMTSGASKSYL